jgi:hypothetical protein
MTEPDEDGIRRTVSVWVEPWDDSQTSPTINHFRAALDALERAGVPATEAILTVELRQGAFLRVWITAEWLEPR